MTGALVSAVVTTHDRPKLVRRAVRSVLDQTYEPLQVVVIEDGTDSGVEEWLSTEVDADVQYVAHDRSRGSGAARNTGIEVADGKYVAFLDDDDVWKPTFLERATERAERLSPEESDRLGVVYAALEVRSGGGEVMSVLPPENEGDLRESIVSVGASTLDSSLFFPCRTLEDVGGWDESLPSGEVHDMWMKLARAGYRAETIDEPLVVMFEGGRGRKTTNPDVRIRGIREYVDKWRPTYREWFGEEEGERYAQRYFARAIARLAAFNLVAGDPAGALRALRAVFEESDDVGYNLYQFGYNLGEAVVKRFLPPAAVRRLAALERRL